MSPSFQRFAGTLAVAFVAGLACGYLIFHQEDRAPAVLPAQPAPLAADATAGQSAIPTGAGHPESEKPSAAGPAPGDALATALFTASRMPDYFRRQHDLFEIAMTLDAQGIAHALEVTQGFPKYERDWAQPTLIARWLEVDPAAALGWARALPHGEQRADMLREFFHSLGLKNPSAALQYLNAFETAPDRGRDSYAHSVFEAWSTTDPAGAAQAALGLARTDARNAALSASVGRWAERDPLTALAWAQQIPGADARRTQANNVLRAWAGNDPEAALAHALALAGGTERNAALASVINGVAQNDLEAARQMLTQLPEGQARTSGTASLISENAYRNPEAVADLILTLPPAQQRNCAFQVASYLGREDVAKALAWAGQIASDETRAAVTNGIVQTWSQNDPKAAAEYYSQNPPPDGQSYGFTSAVASWAREDPAAALAWARALPDEKARNTAMTGAITELASHDPLQAASLAGTSLSGNAQSSALGQIAFTWASNDPRAAVAWATQLPDATRGGVLQSVTSTWARNDPRAAAQWLDQMPAGQQRDSVVSSFVNAIGDDDPASAMAWAATIGDDNTRSNSVQMAFSHWQRTNKAAAAAWLDQTNTISDTMRANLKRNLR